MESGASTERRNCPVTNEVRKENTEFSPSVLPPHAASQMRCHAVGKDTDEQSSD